MKSTTERKSVKMTQAKKTNNKKNKKQNNKTEGPKRKYFFGGKNLTLNELVKEYKNRLALIKEEERNDIVKYGGYKKL